MKRTLCILLVLVACLVLTSCKDDRYDDLEKRVKALEKGTDQPKTNTPTVKPGDPTPIPNQPEKSAYDWSDMSVDVMYNEILYFDSICPLKGETTDKIVLKSDELKQASNFSGYYNTETYQWEMPSQALEYFWYDTKTDMDNKTLTKNATYQLMVYILDYDTAVQLFDKLVSKSKELQSSFVVSKSDDVWTCTTKNPDGYGSGWTDFSKINGKYMIIYLSKNYDRLNGYEIRVEGGSTN